MGIDAVKEIRLDRLNKVGILERDVSGIDEIHGRQRRFVTGVKEEWMTGRRK